MKTETENAPVVIEPGHIQAVPQTTPATILEMAVSQGADLDKLERLMQMQIEWEKNEAKKAYFKAVAEFKKNPPKIYKDANVNYSSSKGETNYNHATLGNVMEKIGSGLAPHGLSLGFKQTQESGVLTVTCTLTHCQGYSESTSLSAAPDTSGGKNSIQAIGSSNAYLQRYTGLAITGLATHEMDDDGVKSDPEKFLTEDQIANINAMLDSTQTNLDVVLKFGGVEKLEYFPRAKYKALMITWENA